MTYGNGKAFYYPFINFVKSLSKGSEHSYEKLHYCAQVRKTLVAADSRRCLSMPQPPVRCSICYLVSLALLALLVASAHLKCWNKCTERSLELSLASCETHASIDFNRKRS